MPAPVYLTVPEVAARYRRHPNWVRLCCREGKLRSIQNAAGGKYLIAEADADEWAGVTRARAAS